MRLFKQLQLKHLELQTIEIYWYWLEIGFWFRPGNVAADSGLEYFNWIRKERTKHKNS